MILGADEALDHPPAQRGSLRRGSIAVTREPALHSGLRSRQRQHGVQRSSREARVRGALDASDVPQVLPACTSSEQSLQDLLDDIVEKAKARHKSRSTATPPPGCGHSSNALHKELSSSKP